ncbi:double-stranded RNA-specific editase Adar-like [Centruroides vittatus]|uniref:double-stranded RNA-specific editase Adar-like n=1 Tax=Centruroides vittatus TaxID=120091 RepID=UPI00350FDA90
MLIKHSASGVGMYELGETMRSNRTSYRPIFTVTVKINNKEFTGRGHSKQMAKHTAPENALAAFGYVPNSSDIPNKNVDNFNRVRVLQSQTRFLWNILRKWIRLLTQTQLPYHQMSRHATGNNKDYTKRKILAGISMTRNSEMDEMEIISVCTGTKGVIGKIVSIDSTCTSLNDCHAEVLVRRCLKSSLYSHLR